jgi:hypothetical protein
MYKKLPHNDLGRFESPYDEPRSQKVIGVRLPLSLHAQVMELSQGKAAEFLVEAAKKKVEQEKQKADSSFLIRLRPGEVEMAVEPICVLMPKEFDSRLRQIPNIDEWLRLAIASALENQPEVERLNKILLEKEKLHNKLWKMIISLRKELEKYEKEPRTKK